MYHYQLHWWCRSIPDHHWVRRVSILQPFFSANHDVILRLTVSTRIDDDEFELSFEMFKFLCLNLHNLILWLPAFLLAVLLRVITHKFHHQLIFPLCKSQIAVLKLSGIDRRNAPLT